MTQTLNRSTSWRRLRRRVVAGGSAAAMVVGLGVAVAPSASAATVKAPEKVSIDLPDQISNGSDTQAATVKFSTTDAISEDTSFGLKITLPDGVLRDSDCSKVTINNWTKTSGAAVPASANAFGSASYGGDNTCLVTGSIPGSTGLAADTDTEWTFDIAVDGIIPGNPPFSDTQTITGEITAEFVISDPTDDINVSATDTAQLVDAGGAQFDNDVPVAQYGDDYTFQIVTNPGAPTAADDDQFLKAGSEPAAGTDATGYYVYGYNNGDSVSHVAAADTPAQLTASDDVIRGPSSANEVDVKVDDKTVKHFFISLNDDTWSAVTKTNSLTGFFFDTESGTIAYGTASENSDGDNVFTATAPTGLTAAGSFSPTYTWTIVANNAQDTTGYKAPDGDASAATNVGANTHDQMSEPFELVISFSDVSGSNPFFDDINALAKKGIVNGYVSGAYGVTDNITRAQFAAMAGELINHSSWSGAPNGIGEGACSTTSPSAFEDVPNNNQFCAQIRDLASYSVINGYSATKFGPSRDITRQTMAAYLTRLAELANGNAVTDLPQADTSFNDVDASNIFSGDIAFVAAQGIAKGNTDGNYLPLEKTTRQANAAFLHRWGNLFSVFS